MKVYIEPRFEGQDQGDGGIRRVVEAQRKWLPKYGVEVVASLGDADLVATHAAVATKTVPVHIPWVCHTHGLYWSEYTWSKMAHHLNREVISGMRQADHVTAPSEWVRRAFQRGMWIDPTVLYHGVDVDDWPLGTDRGYVLWNKNRADPICDPNPVITLAKQNPDINFTSTLGVEGMPNLALTGVLPYEQAREYVRHASVYLCTVRETFGIGTIEAMAAGVPVVGWDWGGQREIIEHGVTGWLVTPGDHAGLAEGIRWAQANRDEVGAAARAKVVAEFTWETAIKRYVDLYTGVWEAKAEAHHGPKVSVVVPCYNLAEYLPAAIASLEAQTMPDWQAVIVNDASPDDTRGVADALVAADSRVKVVHLAENQYLAGALNAGVAASEGRYIMPLDADNMIEPDTLARLAAVLDSDRTIDIAYGGARFVLEDGTTPDTSVGAGGISGWPNQFSFAGQIQGRNQIPSTALYRRRVHERSGGYRRRWRTSEDADFWTRAVSLGFAARQVSPAPTLIYRQREGSMSREERRPDYPAWYPWSRRMAMTPFGVAETPPHAVNDGLSWSVPSAEPAKVGVVIPVGPGHEGLVIDALDSIEAQTYRQWQVIVVNDTGARLDVPHPWARVLNPDGAAPKLGPGAARNWAIRTLDSTVKWFVPLDADDYLQADAIDVWVRAWADGGGVIYSQWYDDLGDRKVVYDPPDYDARLLLSKGMIHAVTALYPMDAWRAVGGFDEGLSHWEDWDFHLRLANKGICGTKIPAPLWTYRKTTGFRREENMAAFGQGREAILDRWRDYWEGGKVLMACTGCGSGGRQYPKPPSMGAGAGTAVATPARAPEGYVTMEFRGAAKGTRTYKGAVKGVDYRFGNTDGHRRKLVYLEDAPGLESFMEGGAPLFVQVTESLGTLMTAPAMDAPAAPGFAATPITAAPMAQQGGPDVRPIRTTDTEAAAQAARVEQGIVDPEMAARAARAEAPSTPGLVTTPAPIAPAAPAPGPHQVGDLPTQPAAVAPAAPPPAETELRDMTTHELRDYVKREDVDSGDLTVLLMREKRDGGPNRATAVNILETALRKRQAVA